MYSADELQTARGPKKLEQDACVDFYTENMLTTCSDVVFFNLMRQFQINEINAINVLLCVFAFYTLYIQYVNIHL